MGKYTKVLLVVVLVIGVSFSFSFDERKPDRDRILLGLLTEILEKYHYSPSELDDEFSVKFYNEYLENIDFSKRYLIQSDIDNLKPFNVILDNQLRRGDLTFFDLSYMLLSKRLDSIGSIQKEIFSKPFDFTIEEEHTLDPEQLQYAKDIDELKDRWRRYIKYNVLVKIHEDLQIEEDKFEKDSTYVKKSFDEIEKSAREYTEKAFSDWNDRVLELNKEDWLSVYLNVLTSQFDPHTNYFAPRDKEKFDEDMAGQLEGIGARLSNKGGYTTVVEIISGSPSWKQGDLEVEDKIVKVAQGDGDPVNIVGMRLDDSVELIKGKKGTKVRLFVKKIDGSQKEIVLIRDVVELAETFAKSSIVIKNGKKYGLIYLPKFYINFNDKDSRNSATDVLNEIEALKAEGIEGLIFDLRNNGGGSLKTAVDITGYFIERGPVVQIKSKNRPAEVLFDSDDRVQYDGPLVVMINNYSASASEIVAAALRDYNRAVIVGSEHSFGKGTVQSFLDLDRVNSSNVNISSLGSIKLTFQKFYRVNGGATQLKGVDSDCVIPDRMSQMKVGEKEMDNAMPWDTINKLVYSQWPEEINYSYIEQKSRTRVSNSEYFNLIKDNAEWIYSRNDLKSITLNYDAFERENLEYKKIASKYKQLSDFRNDLKFESTSQEKQLLSTNSDLKEKRERWHKNLTKDLYVGEAVNILSDLQN
jgi:carboxyl-terminal processing protease